MKDSKKNVLIIIGNGFDLSHGLCTRFSDFVNSKYCSSETHGELERAKEYGKTEPTKPANILEWNNFEEICKIGFSNILDTKSRETTINSLISRFSVEFKKYLHNKINYAEKICQREKYFELFNKLINQNINILIADFNYTPTLENVYSNLFEIKNSTIFTPDKRITGKYFKIHGNYDEENIVLGHDLKLGKEISQESAPNLKPRYGKVNLRLIESFERFSKSYCGRTPTDDEIQQLLNYFDLTNQMVVGTNEKIFCEFNSWIEENKKENLSENIYKDIPFDKVYVLGHSLKSDYSFLTNWLKNTSHIVFYNPMEHDDRLDKINQIYGNEINANNIFDIKTVIF